MLIVGASIIVLPDDDHLVADRLADVELQMSSKAAPRAIATGNAVE